MVVLLFVAILGFLGVSGQPAVVVAGGDFGMLIFFFSKPHFQPTLQKQKTPSIMPRLSTRQTAQHFFERLIR
jgi:hypothetical protein